MKKHFIYLIFMLLSCTQLRKEKDDAHFSVDSPIKVIKVDPTMAKTAKFSDLYDRVRFIPLETSEEYLVDQVEKVTFAENRFFILSSSSLIIFDNKGKFISKIDSRGLGPKEYRTLWDMNVDTLNDIVEVLDTPGRKILTFDFNGNLLNVWKHDLIVEAFAKMDKDNYLFYCGNNFNTDISDKLLHIAKDTKTVKGGYFKIDKNEAKYLNFKNSRPFSFHHDSISFIDSFNDTIFLINQKRATPRLVIDFGKYKLPQEMLGNHYEDAYLFTQEVRKKGYAFLINSFFENDNIIFFAFEYEDDALFVYHSKNMNKTTIINKIEDDVNFNNLPIPDLRGYAPKALIKDQFLVLMQPSIFMERIDKIRQGISNEEWKTYQMQHPDIIDIYNAAEITDNPIICLAKIKGL